MTDSGATSMAGNGSTGADTPTPVELSAEELEKRTDIAQKRSAAFGNITALLAKTPPYQDLKIADLAWIAGPALTTGQFVLAEAHDRASGTVMPVGVVMWARVSAAVDEKLSAMTDETIKLDLKDWRSGDIPWIIATVGERRVVSRMLSNLMASTFEGREPRIRARNADGKIINGKLRLKDGEAETSPDA